MIGGPVYWRFSKKKKTLHKQNTYTFMPICFFFFVHFTICINGHTHFHFFRFPIYFRDSFTLFSLLKWMETKLWFNWTKKLIGIEMFKVNNTNLSRFSIGKLRPTFFVIIQAKKVNLIFPHSFLYSSHFQKKIIQTMAHSNKDTFLNKKSNNFQWKWKLILQIIPQNKSNKNAAIK